MRMSIVCVILATIHCSVGCKQMSVWDDGLSAYIPMYALDICSEYQSYDITGSFDMICNIDGTVETELWDRNLNCKGDPGEHAGEMFPVDYVTECDTAECDYALVRVYDFCIADGDYSDYPTVVNFCIATKFKNTNGDNRYYYYSQTCNDSALIGNLHLLNDCSDQPSMSLALGAGCQDGNYYEITYCSITNVENEDKTWIIYDIVYIIVDFIGFGFHLFITIKIFAHLYEVQLIYIGVLPVCFKILFSDRHNWIIEPSNKNKIYAILSPIFFMLFFVGLILQSIQSLYSNTIDPLGGFMQFATFDAVWFTNQFMGLFGDLGLIFQIFYMISTLQYNMEKEKLVKVIIPNKCMKCTKLVTICSSLIAIVLSILVVDIYRYTAYVILNGFVSVTSSIVIRVILLYLYYRGLNNVCHYWYSKQWTEYEKYGETERTHEILLNITRASVIVISSSMIEFFRFLFYIIVVCIVYFYKDIDLRLNAILNGLYLATRINDTVFIIMVSLSTYFVYPFAHIDYEKICNKCHKIMYKYFQKKHQNEVQNGGFDGSRYISNKEQCSRFKNFKINHNQEIMMMPLNNDSNNLI